MIELKYNKIIIHPPVMPDLTPVVYFDQRLSAAHSKRWLK